MDGEGACLRCRGWVCVGCGDPVYWDESFAKLARGHRHVRCRRGDPEGRPEWMRPVHKVNRELMREARMR